MTNTNISTVICEIVDAAGDAVWRRLHQTEYQSTPPSSFDEWQDGAIPINVGHTSEPIGYVDYLESIPGEHNGALMAIGVVNARAELVDGLQCSPELRANALHVVEKVSYRLDRRIAAYGTLEATQTILDGVGIVARTAGVTSTRIKAFPGDYTDILDWNQMVARRPPAILQRAKAAARYNLRSNRPHKLRIHRPAEHGADALELRGSTELRYSAPYPGVISVRSS